MKRIKENVLERMSYGAVNPYKDIKWLQPFLTSSLLKIIKLVPYAISTLILISALSLQSCNSGNEGETSPKPKRIPLVKIQEVETSRMVSSIDIIGTVEANIVTDVKSPADGIIEKLFARENQYVDKDKLIAVINPTDRVALISSNIEKVESLERNLKSIDISSDDYQNLLSELEIAKSDLEYARNMYKTIPVICPMNGMITKRWLDKGSQVSTNENIISITDMSSLVIKAEVNEKYFGAIKRGKRLNLVLNAYPGDTLTGLISLVYPHIDPVSRTVRFDIRIQNFNKSLLPGMMAIISVPVSVIDDALTIPEYAVLTSPDNKNFVFTVDSDTIAYRKMIVTGITSGNKIQVLQGLEGGDKIVSSGQDMLKDNMKVRLMK